MSARPQSADAAIAVLSRTLIAWEHTQTGVCTIWRHGGWSVMVDPTRPHTIHIDHHAEDVRPLRLLVAAIDVDRLPGMLAHHGAPALALDSEAVAS